MKILQFSKGKIGYVSRGLERASALFNEDVIFWGPLPYNEFRYKDKRFQCIQIFEQKSVLELIQSLPKGWHPDVVNFPTVALCYIPDLFRIPYKTILYAADSWGDILYNPLIFGYFDILSCNCIDRKRYIKDRHVIPLIAGPLSNTPRCKSKPWCDRPIDILTIANTNSGFYHNRYRLLTRIANELGEAFRVEYFSGIKTTSINDIYQQSKVVIDFSYVASNRSYEAIMNGCLLFSFEGNSLISDIWSPWEEYVPFNFDNVIELIKIYLEDTHKTQMIIEKAERRFATMPQNAGEVSICRKKYAANLDVKVNERIKKVENEHPAKIAYAQATPLYFNYNYPQHSHPPNWRNLYYERIDRAISLMDGLDTETKVKIFIEASRFSFLVNDYDKSERYTRMLFEIEERYAWSYWILGEIKRIRDGNEARAVDFFEKALYFVSSNPELLEQYYLPFVEKGDVLDGRRLGSFLFEEEYPKITLPRREYLLYKIYKGFGDIHYGQGRIKDAITNYRLAVTHVKIPSCYHQLAKLMIRKKMYTDLTKELESGLEENPYDTLSTLYQFFALLKCKKAREAREKLNAHLKLLRCFSNRRTSNTIRILEKINSTEIFYLLLTVPIVFKILVMIQKKIIFSSPKSKWR